MKKIYFLILLSLIVFQATAQEYKFILTREDSTGEVIYKASKEDNVTTLFIQIGEQKGYHKLDSQKRNTYWRCVDPSKKTDVEIVLENGIYRLRGTINGKKIDRTEASKGNPWYQNFACMCGAVIPESGSIRYECFQPGTLSLHQMEAETISKESNAEETCVRAHPVGVPSKIYHADYFVSTETRELVGYRCAEGPPGTPVTTWTLVK